MMEEANFSYHASDPDFLNKHPKIRESLIRANKYTEVRGILRKDGTLIPYEEMTPHQKGAFRLAFSGGFGFRGEIKQALAAVK